MIDPLASYLARLRLSGHRPATLRARSVTLKAFAANVAPRTLLEATREDMEAWLSRPLAPASRRSYRATLRSFYVWAVDEGMLTADPSARIPTIRVPRSLPRPIGSADLERALATADRRMRAWLLLMALGGLRCLEVAGLRPQDLLAVDGGHLLFLRDCKGGGTASVPAHPAIMEALAVLPIRDGAWWTVRSEQVGRLANQHLRLNGSQSSAHSLRHFAGTSWYRASGHDLLATATLLRHASVATTQVYAQLDPVRPTEVVNAVPRLRLLEADSA